MRPKGTWAVATGLSSRHLYLALTLVFSVSLVTIFFLLNDSMSSDLMLMDSSGSDPRKGGTSSSKTFGDNVDERTQKDDMNGKSASRRVHVFYYPWYGNPAIDELGWNHWDHTILPHWNEGIRAKYLHDIKYVPPDDIGSVYYPLDGPYSSADPRIIDQHMKELRDYVVVVSWWGASIRENSKDGQGATTDLLMPQLFRSAEKVGAKIAIHLEPYSGRNEKTVREDLQYLIEKYGDSPAFYRDDDSGLPVIYLYDSYLTPPASWRNILSKDGADTIRGTKYDAIMLGLYVNRDSASPLVDAGFDGFYTYFAADGFTYGSTSAHWQELSIFAVRHNLKISLSVGPGYDDSRIRPWNSENTRDRKHGAYYDEHWQAALKADPTYVSITSFNEWMEGTQIEPVVPKEIPSTILNGKPYRYADYGDLGPYHYLERTHYWASKLKS